MRVAKSSIALPILQVNAARWKQKSITNSISKSLHIKHTSIQSRRIHTSRSFISFLRRVESKVTNNIESVSSSQPSSNNPDVQTNANSINDHNIKVPFQYLSFYKYIPDD